MITKRDGTKQPFRLEAITEAVFKAACEAELNVVEAEEMANMVAASVYRKLGKEDGVTVDCIQDAVEERLMVTKEKSTARAYIRYRAERDRVREGKSALFRDIDDFLNGNNKEVSKENSNKPAEQLVSHRDLIAGIVSKHVASTVVPADIQELHDKGGLHSHDRDYFISKGMHNCGVYDFETMLREGVKLGDVEISTPNSISTAANVSCQIFSKISGSSYGGQSMHEFDRVMRPYAEKSLNKLRVTQEKYNLPDEFVEEALRKEVFAACQTLIYQIQTVTSPNGQAAFSSISLSLSTDPLCKLIKEEYLKCHMKGIGKNGKTPIFPKVLYFVEDGVNLNENDQNYEEFKLALKCSAKHMYPDIIMAPNNREMTGGSENVISPMGR